MSNTIYNTIYPINKLNYFANKETLNVNIQETPFASYSKIITCRLIIIPTGLVAVTAAYAVSIFATCIFYPFTRFGKQLIVFKEANATLDVVNQNLKELFHLTMACFRGYKSSAIFDEEMLSHFYDHLVIKECERIKKPEFNMGRSLFHKELLIASSDYFQGIDHFTTNDSGKKEIGTPNDKPVQLSNTQLSDEACMAFKRFVYCGFSSLDYSVLFELIKFGQMTQMTTLTNHCTYLLISHFSEHLEPLFDLSVSHEIPILKKECFKYFYNNRKDYDRYIKLLEKHHLHTEYAEFLQLNDNEKTTFMKRPIRANALKAKDLKTDLFFNTKEDKKYELNKLCLALRLKKLNEKKLSQDLFKNDSIQSVEDLFKFILENELPDFKISQTELQRWSDLLTVAAKLFEEHDEVWLVLMDQFEQKARDNLNQLSKSNDNVDSLQQIAHYAHHNEVVNLCMNFKINTHDNKEVDQLFDENAYHLTKLEINNGINIDSLHLTIKKIANTCPNIREIKIIMKDFLSENSFNIISGYISDLKLIENCGKLEKFEVKTHSSVFPRQMI